MRAQSIMDAGPSVTFLWVLSTLPLDVFGFFLQDQTDFLSRI
jgi:hypothetical protein